MEDTLRGTRRHQEDRGEPCRPRDARAGADGRRSGQDIRLTIDADVQNFAQARLGEESAAAVVMDVTNGDIICIASSPSFDPNLFVRGISHTDYTALTENDHRPLANKAVSGAYPPGSTFKMVTALAALEAGRDHRRPQGQLPRLRRDRRPQVPLLEQAAGTARWG